VARVSQWLDQPAVAQASLTDDGLMSAEPDDLEEDGDSARAADAQWQKRLSWSAILGGFPLFIYTLLGGWLVRRALMWVGVDHLIDTDLLKHLGAVAMDVLVVAAMASLNLNAVVSQLVPLSILLLGGCIWTGVCLMVLARRILPASHWFQLGLINYGMSTGTTATGFVLLRVVDPQLDTDAAEDYALAAPFSAPFIGGGLLTVGLPLLVLENVSLAVSASVLCGLVAILIGVGFWLHAAGTGDSGEAAE
jgi:ESS family glutamate:Na+ symporter